MKAALLSHEKFKLVGTGSLPSAAGYSPGNMWVDSNGLAWVNDGANWVPDICKDNLAQWLDGNLIQAIYNSGVDYGNCGRPAWLLNYMRPNVDDFTYRIIASGGSDVQHLFGLGERLGGAVTRTHGLRLNGAFGSGDIVLSLGGSYISSATGIFSPSEGIIELIVRATADGNAKVWYNKTKIIDTSFSGSFVHPTNDLMIGTLDSLDPTSWNHEGMQCCVSFYTGLVDESTLDCDALTLLERFDFNQGTGTSTPGINGTPCNWTDGAPNELWRYKWLEDLSGNKARAIYDTSTSLIHPNFNNNAAVLAITGLDSTDGITQASFAAADNGSTIFTANSEIKSLLYSSPAVDVCLRNALKYTS
jgi:hypothetical protein